MKRLLALCLILCLLFAAGCSEAAVQEEPSAQPEVPVDVQEPVEPPAPMPEEPEPTVLDVELNGAELADLPPEEEFWEEDVFAEPEDTVPEPDGAYRMSYPKGGGEKQEEPAPKPAAPAPKPAAPAPAPKPPVQQTPVVPEEPEIHEPITGDPLMGENDVQDDPLSGSVREDDPLQGDSDRNDRNDRNDRDDEDDEDDDRNNNKNHDEDEDDEFESGGNQNSGNSNNNSNDDFWDDVPDDENATEWA